MGIVHNKRRPVIGTMPFPSSQYGLATVPLPCQNGRETIPGGYGQWRRRTFMISVPDASSLASSPARAA